MRAMILGAGRGARLRPLSALRPKPAMPVRGLPLIAYSLAWLARHGVTEAVVNVHHLPDAIRDAVQRYRPRGLDVRLSAEPCPLGTGGGIRRVAGFLRESDPSVVLASDMLVDLDLTSLVRRHREREDAVTLVLRDDPRGASFGTIGIDGHGRVRRIGRRLDLGDERQMGLYVSVNLLAARAFDTIPERDAFGHLDDWLAPRLRQGAEDIRAEMLSSEQCTWEPVGTPPEYLAANLHCPTLSYLDADARARAEGTLLRPGLVIGAGAELGPGVRLRRAVVWDGERVPPGLRASDGVFAGGRFRRCREAGPVR